MREAASSKEYPRRPAGLGRWMRVPAIGLLLVASCGSCRNEASPPAAPSQDVGPTASADGPSAKAKPAGENPMAGCAMCHVDVIDEFANSKHKAEGIDCAVCHGPSVAHSKDENNEVKPDRIVAHNEIDAFCRDCHPCTRPNAAALATQPTAKHKVCIDCHDTHGSARTSQTAKGAIQP